MSLDDEVSAKVQNSSLLSLNVFTRDVSIPVRSSLRSITPISVTKRAYLEWTCSTTENCVTCLLSFFERWIVNPHTNSSHEYFRTPHFLTLYPQLSILDSRFSRLKTRFLRREGWDVRVKTVKLPLSGTVLFIFRWFWRSDIMILNAPHRPRIELPPITICDEFVSDSTTLLGVEVNSTYRWRTMSKRQQNAISTSCIIYSKSEDFYQKMWWKQWSTLWLTPS